MGQIDNPSLSIEHGSPSRRAPSPVRLAAAAILITAAGFVSASAQEPAQAPPPAPATPAQPAPSGTEIPKAPAAPATTSGMPATVIDGKQVESLLGKSVESLAGEDMGRIVDILAEKNGQMRAAVIDFGGFFGVGSRKIAVDWRSLHFPTDTKADKVIVDLPRNQLRVAPIYKEGEPVVVLGPSAVTAPAGNADPAPAANATPSPAPASPEKSATP